MRARYWLATAVWSRTHYWMNEFVTDRSVHSSFGGSAITPGNRQSVVKKWGCCVSGKTVWSRPASVFNILVDKCTRWMWRIWGIADAICLWDSRRFLAPDKGRSLFNDVLWILGFRGKRTFPLQLSEYNLICFEVLGLQVNAVSCQSFVYLRLKGKRKNACDDLRVWEKYT